MPAPKLSAIDIKKITTIPVLLQQLKELDTQLRDSLLVELGSFNKAYEVVTEAIYTALTNNYFTNPEFIERFTVCFSHYYFEVINNALEGKQDIAVAWSNLLQVSKKKPLPNFVYLLMGANAHINHDLALAMKKMLANDNTDNLLKDIIKVDKLLLTSAPIIVSSFSEVKPLPRVIKKRFKYLYLHPIMYMILYWRFQAWRNYKKLKNNKLNKRQHQQKGKSTSLSLIYVGKLLT